MARTRKTSIKTAAKKTAAKIQSRGMDKNLKTFLYIAGTGVAIYAGIKLYQYLKVSGSLISLNKKKVSITKDKAKRLCGRVITDALWFSSDAAVYVELNALTDDNLKFVSNIFLKNFSNESNGRTLYKFINEEKITSPVGLTSLLERLKNLS